MPSFFIVGNTQVSVKNMVFKYSEYYAFVKKTFEDRGYLIEEKKYSHAPDKNKNYVDFYWACLKNIDDYSRFKIEVDSKFYDVKRVKVLKGNKKEIKDKGEGTIKLRATLITDYDKKWEENPVVNFIKTIFENLFEKSSVEQYKSDLVNEMYELENELKSYFNVQRMI